MRPIAALIGICVLAVSARAWQPDDIAAHFKRVYVEPFTTRSGSEALRGDVIGELRKLKTIAIADSASHADLILGGGGEIWVAGYRSLNPRSGTGPGSGTAVYGGYLAVELRDKNGGTAWSDLVTPAGASDEISKDLAKRIARHVAEALPKLPSPESSAPPTAPAGSKTSLKGAGATFPFPVYEKWFANYGRQNPAVSLTYEAIGSEAGIRALLNGDLDFAASDSPEAIHDLARAEESKYLLIPSVIGAVVPIVNLPGLSEEVRFTPEALAGIYSGKIKKWNDPILQRANRGVHLPDLEIRVVHRSDGSGTSYAFTDYLSKTSADWKAMVGKGLSPQWPVGRAARGNEGVAEMVKEIGGSIGYVEFIYALRNHLHYGRVENSRGEFVDASLESIGAAVHHAVPPGDDLKASIVNAPGEGSYPIASFTWIVVPLHSADAQKRTALANFLQWMLGPGQTQAAALGYLELPKEVVTRARAAIEKLR
jgi:phosphate transport system substrate-binding protein